MKAISTGQSINFQVNCADQDGNLQTVNWYVNGVLDHSTSISGSSASASWNRTFPTAGTFNIGAQAGDSTGLSSELAWTVTVTAPMHAPTITKVSPSGDMAISTGQSINFQTTCADQDGNLQTVNWYVNGVLDHSTSISGSSASASWNRTFPTAGTFNIGARSGDSTGLSSELAWIVTVTQSTGNISARLKNTDGTDAPVAGGTPRFKLYTSPNQTSASANPATFSNIPVGTYLLEGYQTGTFWREEFWASDSAVVNTGATTPVTLLRNYPHATSVVISNVTLGGIISASQVIAAGTQVRAYVTVRNDVPGIFSTLDCEVRFLADKSMSLPYDYDSGMSVSQSIPGAPFPGGSGDTRTFIFTFPATTTGQYHYALQVQTSVNSSFTPTDSRTWTPTFAVPAGLSGYAVGVGRFAGQLSPVFIRLVVQ